MPQSVPRSQQPADQEPRIRLYGLLSVTRRQYLWSLLATVSVLAALVPAWSLFGREQLRQYLLSQRPGIVSWLDYAPWVFAAVVALEVIEACVVLRRFGRLKKEAKSQRTNPPFP